MRTDRTRLLLIVVGVLLLLRFGVVPWVRSQNEAHDQLEVLTNRLDRSLGVVNNRQPLQAALTRVRADVETLRKRYPAVPNSSQFRLEVQRKLGDVAAANSVQLRTFDWQVDGDVPAAGLAYGHVRVTVEGPLKNVVRLHGSLEGELPYIAVRDLNMNFTSASTADAQVTTTASFVIDVYFRKSGA
jgi:hypothetical protein